MLIVTVFPDRCNICYILVCAEA